MYLRLSLPQPRLRYLVSKYPETKTQVEGLPIAVGASLPLSLVHRSYSCMCVSILEILPAIISASL